MNLLALCHRLRLSAAVILVGLGMLSGCATTAGDPRDPLESLNRGIYKFNDGVDTVLLKPAAEVYREVLPAPVRTGISNVFSNLNDVIVALNNLLQGKLEAALSDVARVMINTTVGVLGIFDVATKAGLEKHDEDFGQTLGKWGVGDGPYIVLPFLGPRNLRDTVGLVGDYKADPVTYIDPNRDRNLVQGTRIVARRSELLGASKVLAVAALDEYEFVRDAYLQRRRNLIYDGNPPREKDDGARLSPPGTPEPHGVNPRMTEAGSELKPNWWSSTPPTPAEEEAMLQPSRAAMPAPANPTSGTSPGFPSQPLVRVWLPKQDR